MKKFYFLPILFGAFMTTTACEDASSTINHNPVIPTGICGDGKVNAYEECDDGGLVNGDGCDAKCSLEEGIACGNNNKEYGEQCDDGNTVGGDGCSEVCKIEGSLCGNSQTDDDEECDDGNTVNGDGCSAECKSESSTCGNQHLDEGEVCDDGNTVNGDGCSANCLSNETCGNKMVDLQEVCDDGNTTSGDGCKDDCSSNERCGNKIVDTHMGEQCDGDTWCDDKCRDKREPLADEDGDTIADENEGKAQTLDSDGDTTPDYQDSDSDNDTIPDSEEAQNNGNTWAKPVDSDKDGIPDYLDLDSDNDTISDETESSSDFDQDTIPNYLDLDSDNDTIPDKVETADDQDKDGAPNYLDLDADDDTIPDWAEYYGTTYSDVDADTIPNFLDTDSDDDKIIDNAEKGPGPSDLNDKTWAPSDSDDDTIPDFLDDDNDNDSVKDSIERMFGSDPNNPDSDGDTIMDGDDGVAYYDAATQQWLAQDNDNDHIINALDLDSDADGISDSDESQWQCVLDKTKPEKFCQLDSYGRPIFFKQTKVLTQAPPDADADGVPDFLDLDSDGDGLPDAQETLCPNIETPSRYLPDTDGDKVSDAVEYGFAKFNEPYALMCDANKQVVGSAIDSDGNPVKLYFQFNPHEKITKDNQTMTFVPKVSKLDVVFNMDTTASMSPYINTLKSKISEMVASIKGTVADSYFGVSSFEDFPVSDYGFPDWDRPWRALGRLTNNQSNIQNAVNLYTEAGGIGSTSGMEALYQILSGSGVNWSAWTGSGYFDKTSKLWPAGSILNHVAPPERWGGLDFRNASLPVIVHMTDVEGHDNGICTQNRTNCGLNGKTKCCDPYSSLITNPHYSAQVINLAKAKGARIITIQILDAMANQQLTRLAQDTGAVVPVCAFMTSESSWGCGANQCCTGNGGTAVAPTANKCTLKFLDTNASQTKLNTVVVQGVNALVKYGTFDVVARLRGKKYDDLAASQDSTCFISKIVALSVEAPKTEPDKSCYASLGAAPTTFPPANYNNGFTNFAVGSTSETDTAKLIFEVQADIAGCTGYQQGRQGKVYEAYIDLVDPKTNMSLDTQTVVIFVDPYIPPQV